LQDEIVHVTERGHSLDFVLGLALPDFDSLYLSCLRLESADRAEQLNDMMIASQGAIKEYKQVVKALQALAKTTGENEKDATDQSRFLKEMGSKKGIKVA
jgi:hypothetical protein